MIPIRDINPSSGTPVVNYVIIVLCGLAFLYEMSLGDKALEVFVRRYGLVPVRYSSFDIAAHFNLIEQALPFFTSMFLHGGWLHLIGNMWVLYIFGDNVEGRLGHGPYLVFYVLTGLIASAIQIVTNPGSGIPTIGASGAIAGIMGAYFILYPRARILAFVPIIIFFTLMEIPAYVFLGLWFIMQFFSGALSLASGPQSFAGIAWWAHIGGFVGGVCLLPFFGRNRREPRSGHRERW